MARRYQVRSPVWGRSRRLPAMVFPSLRLRAMNISTFFPLALPVQATSNGAVEPIAKVDVVFVKPFAYKQWCYKA